MSARLLLLAALAATAAAQTPVVTTVVNHGPTNNRYDMVILGDGYTAAQQAQFNTDAAAFVNALAQRQPYATFWSYINVHTVFRASAQSGANHPDAVPPIVVNNWSGASYNTGGTARCLYIQNTGLAAADAALAPDTEGRVMVLVNDGRYGGCASQFAVSYNGPLMTEVEIHEIGHSLGGLADEYDYPNGTYTGPEPGEVNITRSNVGQKWSHWWGTGGISAFQGAGYYLYGLFRPRIDCLMRSLNQQLCAVCSEQIVRVLNSLVECIDAPQPALTTLTIGPTAQQVFSFTNIVPPANNPVVTWKVDNVAQAGQTGTSFTFAANTVPLGQHTVSVTVQDQTTWVRQDPSLTLRDTHTWTVNVYDPTLPDLHALGTSATPLLAQPGTEIDVLTSVRNEGLGTAVNFRIEHFLSLDNTLQNSDIYLGALDVPSLAANAQAGITRRVRLPALLETRVYYLFAVVDRLNTTPESNEANNVVLSAVIVTTPGCDNVLEYRDALVYPRDAASVPIATGGTVLPTVVARCAPAGTAYLIVWGGAGTAPGTLVAPGLTVPLNQDPLTSLGLAAVNGSVLQGFFGTLDATGVGRAAFVLPPATGLLPMPTDFAAVLIGPNGGFSGVTNAVHLDFVP